MKATLSSPVETPAFEKDGLRIEESKLWRSSARWLGPEEIDFRARRRLQLDLPILPPLQSRRVKRIAGILDTMLRANFILEPCAVASVAYKTASAYKTGNVQTRDVLQLARQWCCLQILERSFRSSPTFMPSSSVQCQ